MAREKSALRVGLGFLFVVGSFVVPWPVFLFATACIFISYRILPEAFVLACVFDILYGGSSARFFHFRFAMTLLVLVLAMVSLFVRRRLIRVVGR